MFPIVSICVHDNFRLFGVFIKVPAICFWLTAGVHGRDGGWGLHDQPEQLPALELRLGMHGARWSSDHIRRLERSPRNDNTMKAFSGKTHFIKF